MQEDAEVEGMKKKHGLHHEKRKEEPADNDNDDDLLKHNVQGMSSTSSSSRSHHLGSSGRRRISTRTATTTAPAETDELMTSSGNSDSDNNNCCLRRNLIQPFVSDLAFKSIIISRRYQSQVSFKPYTCHAAVLFVDLCSYSRITAAIAHRGAHFLSYVVNAYLNRLLRVVREFGGDTIKFAGDAILIVWEGKEEKDLQTNVLCAAKCVMQMQRDAGEHTVPGTDHVFRIHCGLACGALESEIFCAPVHENMQRLYHSCGGVEHMTDLVDLAKAGEVCISPECVKIIGDRGTYNDEDAMNRDGPKILKSLHLDPCEEAAMVECIQQAVADRSAMRNKAMMIEEDFIHPAVLRFLSHGCGLSPTQIAQMRSLCVLFVAMTANGNSVNWMMEVQQVLDEFRCPIVQILDDDKGVHIVAAVNLYEAVPEVSLIGLKVCEALLKKQVGCAIGMARGPCFCGVTGSSDIACRWDITGPPAVRAARLMKYALDHHIEVAIDQSLYDDPLATTRTMPLHNGVKLKGTLDPCNVYTLSGANRSVAFRLLETIHASIHDDTVKLVQNHISGDRSRTAVLITGPPSSGKKIVGQRAAGVADLVPFQHNCSGKHGMLELARTMAMWYRYVDVDEVRFLADGVMEHLRHHRLSRAHDDCVQLVNLAMEVGLRACFVVNAIQYLDEFSFSLIRECLHGQRKVTRHSRVNTHAASLSPQRSSSSVSADGSAGRIVFLCVHCGLHNYPSPPDIVEQITRSHKNLEVPIVTVGEASKEDLLSLFREIGDVGLTDRALRTFAENSGYCAGYFVEQMAAARKLSSKEWSKGRAGYIELTQDYMIDIPHCSIQNTRHLTVMQVSAEATTRVAQIFDDLPPVFQTFCKILALLQDSTRKGYFKLPRNTMWEVLNDITAEKVDAELMQIILDELVDTYLLKIEQEKCEDVLSLQSVALADIAFDVCTPIQIDSIAEALIERLDPLISNSFKVPLVIAELHGHRFNPDGDARKRLWRKAYEAFQIECCDMKEHEVNLWKELIEEKIVGAGGCSVEEVLGADLTYPKGLLVPAGSDLKLLQIYRAPIALGPMGHSLSCIFRSTFQEMTAFHGADESTVAMLRRATESASKCYLAEMKVLEDFLEPLGLYVSEEQLKRERSMIKSIAMPAECADDVHVKAAMLLHEYVPIVAERLKRICSMIHKVRRSDGSIPDVLHKAPRVFRRAYEALFWEENSNRFDAAQDSIIVLATYNYKPRPIPEHLPIRYYQTVARIRNMVLSRSTDSEIIFFGHEHSVNDLEAFLLLTPLFYQAQKDGKC